VQRAALLQLCDPHIAKLAASTFHPLPYPLQELGYVPRLEPFYVAVREREHCGANPKPSESMFEKLCRNENRTL